MTSPGSENATAPVLQVRELKKHFPVARSRGGGKVHALDGVDLTINAGEVLGLVGESGSGKSTVGKCIVRLLEPTEGTIVLNGRDISHLPPRKMRSVRSQVHMVFQDPYSSLDPRMAIGDIISEPLRMHRAARNRELEKKVESLLDKVGLAAGMRYRYPHELSGGQRQRVGLARSLSLDPSLLIADEPVSALDVSVQASVLNLLMDLQQDLGFSCLFISHDLATVELLCDRVAVLYLGRVVEEGSREEIFSSPQHPYTQSLLSAIAVPDPALQRRRERIILTGDVPSPIDPPSGCPFHTRCPVVDLPRCATDVPALRSLDGSAHRVSCHLVGAETAAAAVDG